MSLLNVRLSPEDVEIVATLRARGRSISEIVRRALREEAERDLPDDPAAIVEAIVARYPSHSAKRIRVDTTDRRAVQEHIRRKLRKRT